MSEQSPEQGFEAQPQGPIRSDVDQAELRGPEVPTSLPVEGNIQIETTGMPEVSDNIVQTDVQPEETERVEKIQTLAELLGAIASRKGLEKAQDPEEPTEIYHSPSDEEWGELEKFQQDRAKGMAGYRSYKAEQAARDRARSKPKPTKAFPSTIVGIDSSQETVEQMYGPAEKLTDDEKQIKELKSKAGYKISHRSDYVDLLVDQRLKQVRVGHLLQQGVPQEIIDQYLDDKYFYPAGHPEAKNFFDQMPGAIRFYVDQYWGVKEIENNEVRKRMAGGRPNPKAREEGKDIPLRKPLEKVVYAKPPMFGRFSPKNWKKK